MDICNKQRIKLITEAISLINPQVGDDLANALQKIDNLESRHRIKPFQHADVLPPIPLPPLSPLTLSPITQCRLTKLELDNKPLIWSTLHQITPKPTQNVSDNDSEYEDMPDLFDTECIKNINTPTINKLTYDQSTAVVLDKFVLNHIDNVKGIFNSEPIIPNMPIIQVSEPDIQTNEIIEKPQPKSGWFPVFF